MSAQFRKIACLVSLLLAISLAGCLGLPSGATPTEAAVDLEYTQAFETIVAELTQTASLEPPPGTPEEAPMQPYPSSSEEPLPPISTPVPAETLPPTSTPLPTETTIPTDTPLPTETPTTTASPEPVFKVVFQDDFTYTHGWPIVDGPDVYTLYSRGGYIIYTEVKKAAAYSTRGLIHDNLRVEVTASRLNGPLDGFYGVICRFTNGSNYYLFGVGSDGWYGIGRQQGGQLQMLGEGFDTASVIHTGIGTNQIRGDCVGNTLTLYVNGEMLLQVKDNVFSSGAVGIAAFTRSSFSYEALFDDFAVYAPE